MVWFGILKFETSLFGTNVSTAAVAAAVAVCVCAHILKYVCTLYMHCALYEIWIEWESEKGGDRWLISSHGIVLLLFSIYDMECVENLKHIERGKMLKWSEFGEVMNVFTGGTYVQRIIYRNIHPYTLHTTHYAHCVQCAYAVCGVNVRYFDAAHMKL